MNAQGTCQVFAPRLPARLCGKPAKLHGCRPCEMWICDECRARLGREPRSFDLDAMDSKTEETEGMVSDDGTDLHDAS